MKTMLAWCLMFVGLMIQAEVTISDVKVVPLSPGGIGVTYTVSGTLPSNPGAYKLYMVVSDRMASRDYECMTLTGGTGLSLGNHSVVWNAAADGVVVNSENCIVTLSYDFKLYCVINLAAGPSATSYPVTYMDSIPGGSWDNEYKTTKLVLKRINQGAFIMGDDQTDMSHRVTLLKPFYIGVFEVTQKQWELVMGSNPCSSTSYGKGDNYPVHYVSYDMIRGSSDGAKWPSSSDVDATSFIGKLRSKTGITQFDLPTEAQWEYACRAGTTTAYSYGDTANGNYMWYQDNSGSTAHAVGTKCPNPWGLYDMHGNVWEWCLDWYGTISYGTDPKGSSSGSNRVERGGSWISNAGSCTSSRRGSFNPSFTINYFGFRLSRPLP